MFYLSQEVFSSVHAETNVQFYIVSELLNVTVHFSYSYHEE